MAYDRQRVIDIALAEVGYLEKATNRQLDDKTANAGDKNYTKYARDLDAINFYNGRKNGHYWCDVFVDWCFVKAYGKAAALALTCQPTKAANNCGAGCKWSLQYYKSKGQFHTSNPQPGDQIFFYSSDKSTIQHTGLVYKVSGSKVYTVEGNTTGASGVIANGGGVCTKSYSLKYGWIAGYGRPKYGDQVQQTEQGTSYTVYTIKKGDTLWGIAKKYLGTGTRYKEIMTLNGMKNTGIRAGRTLKIPTK